MIKKGELIQNQHDHRPSKAVTLSNIVSPYLKVQDIAEDRKDQPTRVIDMVKDSLLTQSAIVDTLTDDIVKCVVVDRYRHQLIHFVGYVRHSGLTKGAIAASIAHDAHNLIVLGANDADIVMAINRIIAIQGGIVIVNNQTILDELPLPITGLMSDRPLDEVVKTTQRLQDIAQNTLGFEHSIVALTFLALPVIPYLKMNPRGYIDVLTQTLITKSST